MTRLSSLPLLALAACAPALAVSGPAAGKVTAPVDIQVTGRETLRITTRPRVDGAALSVAVVAGGSVQLADSAEWKAAPAEGVETVHEVVVSQAGPGEGWVVVSATLTYRDGSSETALRPVPLVEAPVVRGFARLPDHAADVVVGPDGRLVIEVLTATP